MFLLQVLQYKVEKKVNTDINPKSVIPKEYQDYLNTFSKNNSDILSLYQKYNHKIHLKKEQKSDHILIYKLSFKKLDIIK